MSTNGREGGGGPETLLDFDVKDLKLPQVPKGSGRAILGAFVVVLVLGLLFSSVFQVETEEVGIILRFGRYTGIDKGPGLHFKIPIVDRVYRVPVERQLKAEFGFRTQDADIRSTFVQNKEEANMLTGDENAALVEWVVQYRVVDPYRYLFRVRNIELTFRDMSQAVMREVVGDRTVSEVVTIGRVEIESEAERLLQDLCDQYETGLRVEQVVLQTNNPPDEVKPSFDEVNQAKQDRDRLINEAQSQYNRVIPRAEGEARQAIQQAEGYALDRVNRSQGDAARFAALYDEYRRAPEVTRKRLYLETMSRVLPEVGRKIVIDDDVEGLAPLLDMRGLAASAASPQPRRSATQENQP